MKVSRRGLLAATGATAAGATIGATLDSQPADAATGIATLIHRVPTDEAVAFITIDDGYFTDAVCDAWMDVAANANSAKVTQFLTYYAASSGQYPPPTSGAGLDHIENLRKYQSGTADQQRVGCHGKEHLDYRTEGESDQQASYNVAANLLGDNDMFFWRPRLFRPPNGQYNHGTLVAAYAAGMPWVVRWTHWVNTASGAPVLTNEYGTPVLQPGSIVVIHHPSGPGQDGFTMNQLQVALNAISAANLEPAYLHDYLT